MADQTTRSRSFLYVRARWALHPLSLGWRDAVRNNIPGKRSMT